MSCDCVLGSTIVAIGGSSVPEGGSVGQWPDKING
jgi:predicted flavoprotein YhiN